MLVFRAVRSVDEMLMKIVVCVAGRSMLIAWVRVGTRLVAAVLQTRARSGGVVEGTMADVSLTFSLVHEHIHTDDPDDIARGGIAIITRRINTGEVA